MEDNEPSLVGSPAESTGAAAPGLDSPAVTSMSPPAPSAPSQTGVPLASETTGPAATPQPVAEAATPLRDFAGGDRLAICCSGGGIRSASYCLGALQALQQAKVMDRARWVLGVSGGGYISASRALVAHGLPGKGDHAPAYAPGTPEERNLRNNTHYLAPDTAVVLTGVLSLLLGVAVTFVLVFAPLYAAAHAWGWLLRWQELLAPSPGYHLAVSAPVWPAALPSAAGAITLVLFVGWWLTLARRTAGSVRADQPAPGGVPAAEQGEPARSAGKKPDAKSRPGSDGAAWVWRAALAAVMLATVLLAVPAADAWLFSLSRNSAAGTIVHFFGFGRGVSWSPDALAGLIAAVLAVARFCQTGLARWHALTAAQRAAAGGGQSAAADAGSASKPGLLTRAGMWARQKLLPWAGSAVIVLTILLAGLLWTGDGARAGLSSRQLTPVLVAAGVTVVLSLLCNVNRTSMHDFYRWRLANAFAVTRDAILESTPRARRQAAATRLSELKTEFRPGAPELVICATANINAGRETPPGQGGFSLTFDPEYVALHREAGSAEPAPVRASTSDCEALIGHDRATLFDLSAISGAAISPLMGSATRHAYRILFTATNMRLGVWLPHPRVVAQASDFAKHAAHLAEADGAGGEAGRLGREAGRLGKEAGRAGGEARHVAAQHQSDRWWTRLPMLLLLWYRAPHPWWDRNAARNEAREARLWAHVFQLQSGIGMPGGKPRRVLGGLWYRIMQPTLGLLWAEAAGRLSYRSTWMYVSDGGHYDNLGLVEALRRGAENIVVLDASGDKADTWFTLGTAIALARADQGVDIKLDPTAMARFGRPLRAGQVGRPWVEGTFKRRDDRIKRPGELPDLPRRGNILVCKLGWWQGAPWDVRAYAARHPAYPGDSTLEQLYDGAEFEAYRELGAAAVDAAVEARALVLSPVDH
jgi:hypothetical protein